jgi:Tfp pilus assembly protein PilF
MKKIGRNDPCPCGSGKKYKQCCASLEEVQVARTHAVDTSIPKAIQAALEHHQAGRLPQAEAIYRQILQAAPNHPEALHLLGVIAHQTGKNEIAVELISKAIRINPSSSMYCNLGAALRNQGKLDAAVESYRKALSIKPDYAEAHNNLGNTLQEQGKLDAAVESYRKALSIKPDYAEALSNRGTTLQELRHHAEAIAMYRRALALKPDYPDALYNESLAHLCLGDFQAGWEQYEFRWTRKKAFEQRPFKSPKWLGGDAVVGKRLLLWAEQGLGDTIQFCRYAPILARKGVEVFLEVPSPLKALLGTLEGVTAITTETELPPAHDYHCPLLSLPLALKTEISGIPNDVPYLTAAPDKVRAWKQVLEQDGERKVGIVCSGSPDHKGDRNRSIPLRQFSPLLETGASFYLLQTECRPEDEAFLSETSRIRDLRQRLTDFTETAAVIACLDLVICVDTSVAHLAGALGKPVWILLPFSPDWRWMLGREDSPWYPTARLFRQTEMGDWQGVIERVREALFHSVEAARRTMEIISLS